MLDVFVGFMDEEVCYTLSTILNPGVPAAPYYDARIAKKLMRPFGSST